MCKRLVMIAGLSVLVMPILSLAQQAKQDDSTSYEFKTTVSAGSTGYKNAMAFLKARFADYPESWLYKINLSQTRVMEVSASFEQPWKSKGDMDRWLSGKTMPAGAEWSAKACARFDGSLPAGQLNHNYNFTWTFQRQCEGKDCGWTVKVISMKLEPPCK